MLNNVTAIIKAFERPDAVINLYNSIRKFYPELKIIIIDDSKEAMDSSVFDEMVEYIHTEFDIGLSAGRNLALSKVNTKYFLLLDDDFIFTEDTKLENMYKALEEGGFDIVSGIMFDNGTEIRKFAGKMEIKDNLLNIYPDVTIGKHNGYKLYDIVLNFFMADTAKIKEIGWDNKLKLAEHEDFFLKAKAKGLLITCLDNVKVHHFPILLSDYKVYRERVWEYRKIFLKENNLDEILVVRKKGLKQLIKRIPILGKLLLNIKRKIGK